MILTKSQFDAANAVGREFYNQHCLTMRLAVAVGVRVVFSQGSIEVFSGLNVEKYTLMEDFQQAYASVV
ncbi:hypothetical protein D3C87_324930 [compost metagenome]